MSNRLRTWAGALLAGVLSLPFVSAYAGTVSEVSEFGANPGHLRMFRYRPDTVSVPAPLVVALHGCQQSATDYARQAGWV
ncbi:MAG TPA: hypothetical protein PLM32_13030, partial [Candidatus Competibacter sp.]|nr:hypothetical protein [Candidatus Competibacter sp.]